jgi:soluble lytic murein transglycosylase
MKTLKRYKYHLVAALILIALLLFGARTKMSQVTQSADELPRIEVAVQLSHALELFPNSPLTMTTVGSTDIRQFVLDLVKSSLSQEQKGKAFEIARSVIVEANHHKMDPLFLLAVIHTESKFNNNAVGTHGELGLMQILPRTAKWLAAQAGLPTDNLDLRVPAINIRLGATYIAFLRHSFKNQSVRYISAYNMGAANVRHLIATNVEPSVYATRILTSYKEIYLSLAVVPESSVVTAANRAPASNMFAKYIY